MPPGEPFDTVTDAPMDTTSAPDAGEAAVAQRDTWNQAEDEDGLIHEKDSTTLYAESQKSQRAAAQRAQGDTSD